MNHKLHIPKSIKNTFDKPSVKQFLLSLVATTVSIALTFGTAAIIDNNKKQAEKRKIVMMVMYDMYNSLQEVQTADSLIRNSMNIQLQIAEDTTTFNENRFVLIHSRPSIDYTETVEKIFSSSIETINTIGSVPFVENVAKFYQCRKQYKETVCDSLYHELGEANVIYDMNNAISFDYPFYLLLSSDLHLTMDQLFSQCQQMMDVTIKQLNDYRKDKDEQSIKTLQDDNLQNGLQFMHEMEEKMEKAKEKLK